MTLEQLHTFLTVADTAHFGAAADALFISQPAVSKRIAQLESRLDVRLFDRIGKRVTLTPAGHKLRERAAALLAEVSDIERDMSNTQTQIGGTLTLGMSHHIALHRMPMILQAFSQRYPAVKLIIDFLDSEYAYLAVEKGTLDMAIITLPEAQTTEQASTTEPSIVQETIWHDALVFTCAQTHDLAKTKSPMASLATHAALLPNKHTRTRDVIDQQLNVMGQASIESHMTTHYLETIRMMTEIGLGWSVLPQSMITPSLHVLNAPKGMSRELGYVIHPQRTLPNAAHAMIAMLKAQVTG